jgi:hypothetical protein
MSVTAVTPLRDRHQLGMLEAVRSDCEVWKKKVYR